MAKGNGGFGASMKKVGRNMARANQQSGSAKAPMKFAKGGAVRMPEAKDMGSMGGAGMEQGGFGSGKARGGKAATKGKAFRGTF